MFMNLNNSQFFLDEIKKNKIDLFKSSNNNITLNVSYNHIDGLFNATTIFKGKKYYSEILCSTVILFSQEGLIKSFECTNCNDKDCEHLLVSYYIISKNLSSIFNRFDIKTEKRASELILDAKRKLRIRDLNYLTIGLEYHKEDDLYYELSLKVGNEKQYVLRKKINDFITAYKEKKGAIEFGKNYIYDAEKSYFNKSDKQIIDILPVVLEKAVAYDNSYKIDDNFLVIKDMAIKVFFDLLNSVSKSFELVIKNRTYHIKKISADFNPQIEFKKQDKNLVINFNDKKIIPLTTDYDYIFYDNQVYYIDDDKKLALENYRLCKNIVVDEKDIDDFNKYLLPEVRKYTNNIDMDEELKNNYHFTPPVIKLYFDMQNDQIVVDIKATYDDIEVNINDENNYIKNGIVREQKLEQEAINYVGELGFVKSDNQLYYIINSDDDALMFLKEYINKIDHYEAFISNKLKEVKYIKSVGVKSSVCLDEGEMLRCDFAIDGVSDNEIKHILDAVRYQRKYYKLKNGSFLNLESSQDIEDLTNLVDSLEINYNDIGSRTITIPKFRALYIASKKSDYQFLETNKQFDNFINNFKKFSGKTIAIPKEESFVLRDYQESGIKWLINIANYGFGGILADEMGLGKTLQTIMYIKHRLMEDNQREILIVCPTSLIYNWEDEFKKFAPSIKVKVIAEVRSKREKIFEELHDYEVFITSYGLLREDYDKYETIRYDTMIIDEAQAIKNIGSKISQTVKDINADIKIALTGTPIENSLLELYSIFDYIMPGFFGSAASFSKKYEKNINNKNQSKGDFNKLISPFILRRKKRDVIKELPDKIEKNILFDLNKGQKQYYLAELSKINEEVAKNIQNETFTKNKLMILQSLTRLRQICISPTLYVQNYKGESAKVELLMETIVSSVDEHKILVFSQFTSALSLVIKSLEKENISYFYLDGSTKAKERLELTKKFNDEKNIKVFLISLKAGGNGLNLTGADIVIHLDPWWNPAVENQATDRAHRIGQRKVVEVIKLIAKGTIEEKIIKLQDKKKALSEQVIDGKENSDELLSKLTAKDIIYLLSND